LHPRQGHVNDQKRLKAAPPRLVNRKKPVYSWTFMSIRVKIIFVILPLIMVAVVLAGMSSYFVAASSVTKVAMDFLAFKASELEKYADGQWNLLVENGLVGRADMETAAKAAVESFARSVLRSDTETIIAVDALGKPAMRAGPASPFLGEEASLSALAAAGARGFGTIKIASKDRVAFYFPFRPFNWMVFVTEDRDSFYGAVESIARTSIAILAVSMLVSVLLVLLMARFITRPLEALSKAMQKIIDENDLEQRVPVEYKDEIGQLSHTFNLMLEELGKAYKQIKLFAYGQAVAQTKERKIKLIFEKYVPKDVIDLVYGNPEDMLVGDTRILAVLFSDIRSFTTISEKMTPNDLVDTLNKYFSYMVEVIMQDHGGMVDKYIGDAIMAYWGTPKKRDDDALQSVLAGLDMLTALDRFNEWQKERGMAPWAIGIGINYGGLTVGNIGSSRKMNYTVIGDMVNLASRLEGATKRYHQPIIISESVQSRVKASLRCRHIDTIAVKGKTKGVRVYTTRKTLTPQETRIWDLNDEALELYYARKFKDAEAAFRDILKLSPDDYPAEIFQERALAFAKNPPPASWDGVEVLTEK
jgi:class 3 adenylate cyclase/HAMP domain-containing protein